ncbi:MAG TPA: PhnD/SsuA/transferrin family substrate-binding protein [Roseiflexaceae bacterium]|nr:PhnD/SsuA/transferrin family substrate-binding protein [Roseiflexaceae bacterium]
MQITFVSLLAGNADPFYRALVAYLAERSGLPVAAAHRPPWQERQELLARGEAQIGAVCGAVYVRQRDAGAWPLELLAAPVMRAARYQGQPTYFSDVLVRTDAPFQRFADLRGAIWAYNEPLSYSGHAVVRAYLAREGTPPDFFGRVVASGAHQESLRLLLAGEVDAAAIDSTVLEREQLRRPELGALLRPLLTLGPSPTPPLVVRGLPPAQIQALRAALLDMHRDPEGRRLLEAGLVACFVPVEDAYYDAIRRQLRRAEDYRLLAE